MNTYLEIGQTPISEPCAQVGFDGYEFLSRLECKYFKQQLEEQFPQGEFRVKSFPHDFGTYREVCVIYDDDSEDDRMEAAFAAESSAWENWKPETLASLQEEARKSGWIWTPEGWKKAT